MTRYNPELAAYKDAIRLLAEDRYLNFKIPATEMDREYALNAQDEEFDHEENDAQLAAMTARAKVVFEMIKQNPIAYAAIREYGDEPNPLSR